MPTKLEEMTVAEIYKEMAYLEEQGQALKAKRKEFGDEIRRRSEGSQLDAKLAQFSDGERAELAKRAQTVRMAQADGKR